MAAPFDKSGIIEFFLIEAGEHIQNLNKGLLSLEKDPNDSSIIDELFRAAHTLKGSAAMMGYQGISDVAHKAEDMLGQFRAGSIPIQKETLNFLFDSVDAAKLMVDGVAANQAEDPLVVNSITQSYKDIIAKVQAGTGQAAPAPTSTEKPAAPPAKPAPEKAVQAPAKTDAEMAAPAPSKSAPPPAQASQAKDDLDLAWERTFEIDEEVSGERIADREPAKPPMPAPKPPVSALSTPPVSGVPAAVAPPAPGPEPAALPREDGASLKQEIEESKRSGIQEKRGLGRRASDAGEVEKQFIRVNIERLDNLMNLVGEMVVNRNRLARQVEFIKTLREELAFSQNRLLHEIKKFEEKYEYTLTYGTAEPEQVVQPSSDFMDLEFDRYDDFNLLSRKLTEITNDMNEIMTELAGFFDSFELDTARISTITTNLQDEITRARMVDVDRLYQMFQRPVRDLAGEENKQVNMVVSGGETKIDKTIFEIISDPMMHMVRNAISHGIEPAEERRRLGKEPVGSFIMKARHEGNSIILEIEDDGRGMDPAVLRQTAADKGFMSPAEAQNLTDLEALNLIFRPGFSTAQSVGKISGRGVGMDVVSTHLAKINGRIEIKTEKGVGTKFVIRLPLTLAIAQALIVKFKDQELAVPMNLVEETTRFSFKDIQRAAGEEMVNLRGTLVRLLMLNDLLNVGKFPQKEETFRHPTLILGMAEKRIAVMVEDIVGREEIVVKSLGDYLRGVKMFSGATISGEGNVRLILNIATLFGDESAMAAKASFIAAREAISPEAARRKPRVLVVDDSISIRKYVQRFLDRTGYEVEVAPDGMEALNIMGRVKFDAVITDLEMPVMHGYDLIAEMKRNPALMNIPVIVLTSRAGEKHRQKAIEMGAQDYLVKPFEEQEMLGALKKLLSGATLAHRA
ncbi:MAG TPA: hybrid sensor histidine kinase/response regulator [Nitrospirota bacterium]|nr:hybrid sensor histidine kinase/response regulator [Nitrospirota bacterium]